MFRPLCSLLFSCLVAVHALGQTIDATAFEDFTPASGWVGQNGWQGIGTSSDSQGVDDDLIAGLGNTGFIGFGRPSATFSTVFKRLDHDAVTIGQPQVDFEALIGIEDSTTTGARRDSFNVAFFNAAGGFLASVNFRLDPAVFGVWFSDGAVVRDTGSAFVLGELQLLTVQIDFAANRWSAQLDGVDLFDDATFHAGGSDLDLGILGFQWDLAAPFAAQHGDNFMVVADVAVRAVPTDDFQVDSISHDDGLTEVTFPVEPGFDYRVYAGANAKDLGGEDRSPIAILPDPQNAGLQSQQHTTQSERMLYQVERDWAQPQQ